MPEQDTHRPSKYSIGAKATFATVSSGTWIISKSQPDRPLEVISKKFDEINFWDWEPYKLVQNYIMTGKEFDQKDYHYLIVE